MIHLVTRWWSNKLTHIRELVPMFALKLNTFHKSNNFLWCWWSSSFSSSRHHFVLKELRLKKLGTTVWTSSWTNSNITGLKHLQLYLTYRFSDETSHHHALCVDEEVSLGLRGSAQSHLLETQLVVRYTPHILGLKPNTSHRRRYEKMEICTLITPAPSVSLTTSNTTLWRWYMSWICVGDVLYKHTLRSSTQCKHTHTPFLWRIWDHLAWPGEFFHPRTRPPPAPSSSPGNTTERRRCSYEPTNSEQTHLPVKQTRASSLGRRPRQNTKNYFK